MLATIGVWLLGIGALIGCALVVFAACAAFAFVMMLLFSPDFEELRAGLLFIIAGIGIVGGVGWALTFGAWHAGQNVLAALS